MRRLPHGFWVVDFHLETDRLILRDWRDEDWRPFFGHTNSLEVMRFLGGVMDEGMQQIARARLESYHRDHGFTFWVVERKGDGGHLSGELLGFCGLKRCNQDGAPIGDAEIGWRLRADAWGHGYAREAAIATRDIAFTRFDVPHIVSLTVQENEASWGLMKRIGMIRREDLDFENADFGGDTIVAYALSREDWEPIHDPC